MNPDKEQRGSLSQHIFPPSIQDSSKLRYRLNMAPFVYKYFTKLEDGITIRCNLCRDSQKLVTYSMKHSIFKNPVSHLAKAHGVKHKEAVKRRMFLKSILQNDDNSGNQVPKARPQDLQKSKVFIFRYFTRIDQSFAQCNICKLSGKETIYSVKNSLYFSAERHLQKQHTLQPFTALFTEKRNSELKKGNHLCPKGTSSLKSQIFKYFTKVDQSEIQCNLCDDSYREVKFSIKSDIFKNAVAHLQTRHRLKLRKSAEKNAYLLNQAAVVRGERKIVELVCLEGVPMAILDKQPFFRDAFKLLRLFKPQISSLTVMKEYRKQQEITKVELIRRQKQGQIFCLSFTLLELSKGNYLLLSLQGGSGTVCSLGLIKHSPRAQKEEFQAVVNSKLGQNGIDMSSILCTLSYSNTEEECTRINRTNFICLNARLQNLISNWFYQSQIWQGLRSSIDSEDIFGLQSGQQDSSVQQFQDHSSDERLSQTFSKIRKCFKVAYNKAPNNSTPFSAQFRHFQAQLQCVQKLFHYHSTKIADLPFATAVEGLKDFTQQLQSIGGKVPCELSERVLQIYKELSQSPFHLLQGYLHQLSNSVLLQEKEKIKLALGQILSNNKGSQFVITNYREKLIEELQPEKQECLLKQKSDQSMSLSEEAEAGKEQNKVAFIMQRFESKLQRCQELQRIYCSLRAIPASLLLIRRQADRVQRILANQSQGMPSATVQAIAVLSFENATRKGRSCVDE